MASSKKSERLGLSLWDPTDRPERLDFYKDNEILERKLGAHLANELLHLTPEAKAFMESPYWTVLSTGTASVSRSATAKVDVKLMLMMCTSMPPVLPREDGRLDVYWDFLYVDDDNKTTYSLGGLYYLLSNRQYTAYNRTSPQNSNLVMHMNEQGKKYVTLFLPRLS